MRRLAAVSRCSRPVMARSSVYNRAMPSKATRLSMRMYSDKPEKSTTSSEEPVDESKPEQPASAESSIESPEVVELKARLDTKDKEAAVYKDRYLRSVADFQNLQETTKREIKNAKDYAIQKFAKDLVESVDNFDRALAVVAEDELIIEAIDKSIEGNSNNNDDGNTIAKSVGAKEVKALYDGIKMTQDVFEKTLARHGLQKLNPIGEKFDPNIHEATFEIVQPDKEPGTIFHVQQIGFTLNDRVLRAPKVGVVKAPE